MNKYNMDRDLELGILQDKSMMWGEQHWFILGADTTVQVSLRKFIKWIKHQRRTHPTVAFFQRNTIEFLDEWYVTNWAWIQ